MGIRMWLARLAGARPEILGKAPGDTARYMTMGGVLLSTAGLAGISAFFALSSVMDLAWPICLATGLGWAIVVLNLDRMLVVSMTRMTGRRSLAMAVPRVILAVVIGAVVSTPLVLRIFEPEINAELTTMKAEAVAQAKKDLDNTYASITRLEQEETRLQDVIAGKSAQAVASDPDVQAAQTAVTAADKTYQAAEQNAQCELDGTCGTRTEGIGKSYQEKRAAADRARATFDEAKRTLERVTAAAADRIRTGASSAVEEARKKLPIVQGDLATEQQRRRAAESEATEAHQDDTGMLARLEALDRVTADNASATSARWGLFLLFLCVEILPVVAKLLAGLGGPTLYDRLVKRQEDDVEAIEELRATNELDTAKQAADTQAKIAQGQADAQVQAGQAVTAALVAKQTRIALKAVDTWAELAMLRTDRELDRWLAANTDPDEHIGNGNGHTNGATIPLTPITPPSSHN